MDLDIEVMSLIDIGWDRGDIVENGNSIEENSLMMEEIQIKIAYQGTGLFSVFFKWFLKQLPKNIMHVEAFANKKNLKSQAILKYLGLVCLGENKNGNSFFYKGDYADLLSKYNFDKNKL